VVKKTKKVAAAPYVSKPPPKKVENPLIEKRPKNFGIGEWWRILVGTGPMVTIQVVPFNLNGILHDL